MWVETKEFEIVEIGLKEGVDLISKILYFPMWCYKGGDGGTLLSFSVV